MKETLVLRFLYKTALGRYLLKPLVQPGVSRLAGKVLSSGASKCLVPYFIRKHGIDMENIAVPQGGFASFNDFFTRRRMVDSFDREDGHLISPCDGFLTPLKIKKGIVFEVKHTQYSLTELLKDKELANRFEDGMALVFRLTPANYHRYSYPANGKILKSRRIKGQLHCVRPIATSTYPVYIQNSREYQVIETERFGTMVQMEIGALLVGKIQNHKSTLQKRQIQAGEEKGYFEFGGSTIILLFQKHATRMNKKLYEKRNCDGEILVQQGEFVAWEEG